MVDNLAGGVTAAGARVPAEGIDAGRLVAALVVPFAAGDDGRQCFAAGLLVRDVPIWTFADHCPKFKRVIYKPWVLDRGSADVTKLSY